MMKRKMIFLNPSQRNRQKKRQKNRQKRKRKLSLIQRR